MHVRMNGSTPVIAGTFGSEQEALSIPKSLRYIFGQPVLPAEICITNVALPSNSISAVACHVSNHFAIIHDSFVVWMQSGQPLIGSNIQVIGTFCECIAVAFYSDRAEASTTTVQVPTANTGQQYVF